MDVNLFLKSFSKRLKRLRRQKSLRQVDVANRLQMNYRHYQSIEGGRVDTRLSTVVKLSQLLGIPPSTLVDKYASWFDETNTQNRHLSFEQIINEMKVGFGAQDASGQIIYANYALHDLLGHDNADALIGTDARAMFNKENQQRYQEMVSYLKRGVNQLYPLQFLTKRGDNIPAIVIPKSIIDEDGRYQGSYGLAVPLHQPGLIKRFEEVIESWIPRA